MSNVSALLKSSSACALRVVMSVYAGPSLFMLFFGWIPTVVPPNHDLEWFWLGGFIASVPVTFFFLRWPLWRGWLALAIATPLWSLIWMYASGEKGIRVFLSVHSTLHRLSLWAVIYGLLWLSTKKNQESKDGHPVDVIHIAKRHRSVQE